MKKDQMPPGRRSVLRIAACLGAAATAGAALHRAGSDPRQADPVGPARRPSRRRGRRRRGRRSPGRRGSAGQGLGLPAAAHDRGHTAAIPPSPAAGAAAALRPAAGGRAAPWCSPSTTGPTPATPRHPEHPAPVRACAAMFFVCGEMAADNRDLLRRDGRRRACGRQPLLVPPADPQAPAVRDPRRTGPHQRGDRADAGRPAALVPGPLRRLEQALLRDRRGARHGAAGLDRRHPRLDGAGHRAPSSAGCWTARRPASSSSRTTRAATARRASRRCAAICPNCSTPGTASPFRAAEPARPRLRRLRRRSAACASAVQQARVSGPDHPGEDDDVARRSRSPSSSRRRR